MRKTGNKWIPRCLTGFGSCLLCSWLMVCGSLMTSCGGCSDNSSPSDSTEMLMCEFLPVDFERWTTQDTLVYQLPEQKTAVDADVDVILRFTCFVPYEQLQLSATLQRSDSLGATTVENERLTYTLYDKEGKIQGESFNYHELTQTIKSLHLGANQSYRLLITHCMQPRTVTGVAHVGIRLFKKTK